MAEGVLATARLVLRPPAADDLPFLLERLNTPAVLRHLGGEPRHPDAVREGLAADIAAFASGAWHRWTICLRDGDRPVGRCGLLRVRAGAAPEALRGADEIGWTLAEGSWGRGLAAESAGAVLTQPFGPLHLPLVRAQTSTANAR